MNIKSYVHHKSLYLVQSSQSKEADRQALGHKGEAGPGAELVGVVGTRHKAEHPGQRVEAGVRDLADLWREKKYNKKSRIKHASSRSSARVQKRLTFMAPMVSLSSVKTKK